VTPQEHILVMSVWFKQQQAIRILLDMLKSRNILSADDEQAFSFSQTVNAPSNAALFDEVKTNYLALAKSAGIQTGLEQLPEFPAEFFRPTS
jgi:hypothetical protein